LQCHAHTYFTKRTRPGSPRTLISENPQSAKEKEAESCIRPPLFPWETKLNGCGPMMIITKGNRDPLNLMMSFALCKEIPTPC